MKHLLGTLLAAAFVLSFYAEGSAKATEDLEPLSCSLAGHSCARNADCCSKMCWKGNCH